MSDKETHNNQQNKTLTFANVTASLAAVIAVVALTVALSGGPDKDGHHRPKGPMIGQAPYGPMPGGPQRGPDGGGPYRYFDQQERPGERQPPERQGRPGPQFDQEPPQGKEN